MELILNKSNLYKINKKYTTEMKKKYIKKN